MKKIKMSAIFTLALLLAGCGMFGSSQPTPAVDLNAIRTMAASTALSSLTKAASQSTPAPLETATEIPTATLPPTPTLEITLEPVIGQASANVTVRSEPRKGSDNLGGIFFNQKVSVLGRNITGSWYYILWADAPTGHAWTVSRAVDLQNADITRLPIVDYDQEKNMIVMPPYLWEINGTPLPIPPVPTGSEYRTATVSSPANLRICPSPYCQAIDMLAYGQAVNMTGRYGDNEWAQIDYPSGPGAKAWISSSALSPGPDGMSGLPYFNALATPITPEPPTATLDPNISPTPSDTPEPTPAGPQAIVDAETIVYSLPSTLSAQVAVLKARDTIAVTGISVNGLYYQIQYPPLTDSRAYISQKNIRVLGDMRFVIYFDDKGNPIPTP